MVDSNPEKRLTKSDLIALRDRAKRTLDSLVTLEGIYASTDDGWKGPYYGWFGRDSAITTDLICAAVAHGGDKELADRARRGLAILITWQGKKDDATTGEERGKFPHEIRRTPNSIDHIQHASGTNERPWYVDSTDGMLKNWDSVDSTALWVLTTIRAHNVLGLVFSNEVQRAMRNGLEWIMRNIEMHDGLVAFIGADIQVNRQYSGLHNQGWKDSLGVYQSDDGTLSPHPIKDVLVNAEAWAALFEASSVYEDDQDFSLRLTYMANQLKVRFNDKQLGFLLPDENYYAQAIDGLGRQLPQISADVGMCLWASHAGISVIDTSHIPSVIQTIMGPTMLNPLGGVRNYAIGTSFRFNEGTLYHGSPNTYWPFVSALTARGLDKFLYKEEAVEVIVAFLVAVNQLGSNIEMFIETPAAHRLTPWRHPRLEQESSTEQAWTAAAVYYGALYLLNNSYAS